MSENKGPENEFDEGFNEDFDFGPDSTTETKSLAGASTPQQSSRKILILFAVVLVAVGGYVAWFTLSKSKTPNTANSTVNSNAAVTPAINPSVNANSQAQTNLSKPQPQTNGNQKSPSAAIPNTAKTPSATTPPAPNKENELFSEGELSSFMSADEKAQKENLLTIPPPPGPAEMPAIPGTKASTTQPSPSAASSGSTPGSNLPSTQTSTEIPFEIKSAEAKKEGSIQDMQKELFTEIPKTAATMQIEKSKETQAETQQFQQALGALTKLNQQMETSLNQIKYLDAYTREITETVGKLNSQISAMDNRILALTNTANSLSKDVGTVRSEVGYVKRALGEDTVLDITPVTAPAPRKQRVASGVPLVEEPEFSVHAVIPGRAWLKSSKGQIVTVTEGDSVGNYGKILVIDATNGVVLTNSGITFR